MKMDISRLSLILIIFILFPNEGAGQTLQCGQSDVAILGQPFELYCTLVGEATDYYSVVLKKGMLEIMNIQRFNVGYNASFNDSVKSRLSAVISVIPGVSRTVTVKFRTLECTDNNDYNWEIFIYTTTPVSKKETQTVIIKVVPLFGNEDGKNITYSPSTNLVEGDVVTFTCQGDVGNNPVGNLLWFYYLNGNSTATNVSDSSMPQDPQDSTAAGRTCSKTRVSTLALTLTKAMHWFVVRCTVNQDQPFNATGRGYKMTQQINVQYKPAITSLNRVPVSPYTEGDELLTLTCTADSNPPPSYYWIYESEYSNRSQIGTGPKLELRNLTLNHTGVYTCVAYSLIKGANQTVNASVPITVVERPTAAPTTTTLPSTSGSGSVSQKPATAANTSKDTDKGALIGGIVGGLGGALIIISIIVVCYIRKGKKGKEIEEPPEKPRKPDLVSSEHNMRNNMALNSSFNNSFDSTDNIKRDDGLTYIDLQFENKPGNRRPIQLCDNNSGTQYADINLGSLPRV